VGRLPSVLVLAPDSPWPVNSGARQRTAETINALARRARVSVVCFSARPEETVASGRQAGVDVLAAPFTTTLGSKTWNAVALLARGRPLQYTFLDTHQMRTLLRPLGKGFDVVLVHELSMAGVAISAELPHRLPTILDQFNAEYARAKNVRRLILAPTQRLRLELHILGLRRFEPWALAQMAGCIFVSEADRELVLRAAHHPPIPSIVIPSGVNTERRRYPDGSGKRHTPIVAFVGSLDYTPNIEAARWLVDTVMPMVRRRVPADLHLIGRRPHRSITEMTAVPWVHLYANVADAALPLATADAVAVPVRHGGGTKLKTLEALASGHPVVSTTMGVQGIDVTDGKHLLLADEASTFANALILVLTDRELATRLADAGLAASERYSWTRIGAAYSDFVLAFAGTRSDHASMKLGDDGATGDQISTL